VYDVIKVPLWNENGERKGLVTLGRDLTEQRRAEKALREKERFNRTIIQSARQGIVVYDRDMKYLVFNPFMEELYGLSADQVLGKRASDIFPHLREQDVQDAIQRALSGETLGTPDKYFTISKTGKSGWTRAVYSPHRDAQGEIIGVVVLISDITERKKALLALQESEENFRKVFDATPYPLVICRLEDSRVVLANHTALEFFQVEEKDLGSIYSIPFYADSSQRDWILEQLRKGEDIRDYVVQVRTTSGDLHWLLSNVVLIEYKGEKCSLLGGTDISERRRAEEALRESEAFNRAIIESAGEGIIVFDRNLRIGLWNPFIEKITDVPIDRALGKTFDEIFPHLRGMGIQQTLAQSLAGETIAIEFNIPVPKGKGNRWLRGAQSALCDARGRVIGVLMMMNDITESKQMEESMLESEKYLRSLVDDSPNGISLIDEGGRVVEWNAALARTTGVPPAEAKGHFIWDVMARLTSPESRTDQHRVDLYTRVQRLIQEFMTGKPIQPCRLYLYRPDGNRRYVEQSWFPIQTDKGIRIGAFITDIDEFDPNR
jgi:PAS domain S-box-containing protein